MHAGLPGVARFCMRAPAALWVLLLHPGSRQQALWVHPGSRHCGCCCCTQAAGSRHCGCTQAAGCCTQAAGPHCGCCCCTQAAGPQERGRRAHGGGLACCGMGGAPATWVGFKGLRNMGGFQRLTQRGQVPRALTQHGWVPKAHPRRAQSDFEPPATPALPPAAPARACSAPAALRMATSMPLHHRNPLPRAHTHLATHATTCSACSRVLSSSCLAMATSMQKATMAGRWGCVRGAGTSTMSTSSWHTYTATSSEPPTSASRAHCKHHNRQCSARVSTQASMRKPKPEHRSVLP